MRVFYSWDHLWAGIIGIGLKGSVASWVGHWVDLDENHYAYYLCCYMECQY